MKKVYICSPCRGDYENNIQRAKEYSRAAVEKGVIPVTPHIYLTQFMDDNVPEERELALKIGSELVLGCSELWAFGIDHPSAGMAAEIELAKAHGIPVRNASSHQRAEAGRRRRSRRGGRARHRQRDDPPASTSRRQDPRPPRRRHRAHARRPPDLRSRAAY